MREKQGNTLMQRYRKRVREAGKHIGLNAEIQKESERETGKHINAEIQKETEEE